MSKTINESPAKKEWDFIVLDSVSRLRAQLGVHRTHSVSKESQLADAILKSSNRSVWIMMQTKWTKPLMKAVSTHPLSVGGVARSLGKLVLCKSPSQFTVLPSLHSCFQTVVGDVPEFRMLPLKQLPDALASDDRGDLFIGGIVDEMTRTLTLVRGDLRQFVVPLPFFRTAGPTHPTFQQFELDDYGHTIRFGDYEATAHSVLFEVDADYRRRFNKQRLNKEQGFGPSLRRLRILRGLSRSGFPGITSKTIARIEQGVTERPHGSTLDTIAKSLNVKSDEIESY